jgi:hypothetical protein
MGLTYEIEIPLMRNENIHTKLVHKYLKHNYQQKPKSGNNPNVHQLYKLMKE